jgi:diguanylate cyclase (GGDEF)-like protein
VTVLLLAVPVGVLAWAVATELAGRERERADTQLASALRAAEAGLAFTIAAADADARRLARIPAMQRAVVRRDAAAASRLERSSPGLIVYARGERLTKRYAGDVFERTVAVLGPGGRRLGQVGIAIRLDDALLERLRQRAGVPLVVERGSQVAAGPFAAGQRLELSGIRPRTIELDGDRYRAIAARLPQSRVRLVAVTPAVQVEAAAAERERYVALAALATLFTLVIAAEALVPIIRRRLRRSVGAEDEESLELLGSALAVSHDRAALLPVILETAMDATGAVGGVLEEGGLETARIGEIPPLSEPLRLRLAGENGSEAIALLYPPFGGFSPAERMRAERLAAQAAVAVEHARQHAIARHDAVTDPLTGLANRRRFMEQLAAESKRRARSGLSVAVIVADLDDFKHVNDRYGHETGDDVLRAFAGVLKGTVREIDIAARLGGEEFAVLLPETDAAGAAVLAGRLRERLERVELDAPGHGRLGVTASFGFATSPPVDRVEDLLAAADEALYRAKHEGKNRVVEAVRP